MPQNGGMSLGSATRVAAAVVCVLHAANAFAPGLAPGGHSPAALGGMGSSVCAQPRGRMALGGRTFGLRGASMIDWTDKQVPPPSNSEIMVTLADLKTAFKAMDEAGKGEIQAEDVLRLLQELGYTTMESKCLFEQMDVDNNLNISEDEFIKGCVNEGVCEIVDPDAVLGKGASSAAEIRPNSMVKLIETEQLDEVEKKLARGFYARVISYVTAKAGADKAASTQEESTQGKIQAAGKKEGVVQLHSEEEFYKFVDAATVPVVVKFYANWCRKCMAMGPKFKKIAAGYGERALFVKIDIEEAGHLAKKQSGVVAIPTFQVWKGRSIKEKYVAGSIISKVPKELCAMIDRNLDCGFSLVSEISSPDEVAAMAAPQGKMRMEGVVEVSTDAMAAWRKAQAAKNTYRRPMP